jgi:hypothetical protein
LVNCVGAALEAVEDIALEAALDDAGALVGSGGFAVADATDDAADDAGTELLDDDFGAAVGGAAVGAGVGAGAHAAMAASIAINATSRTSFFISSSPQFKVSD